MGDSIRQDTRAESAGTILLASYGRLGLLQSAVESALAQTYENYEVLIVDDGSDEATRAWLLAAEQQHARVRVVFQDHQGVAAARARGVLESRSDLICILDSDDTLAPNALRRLCEVFQAHPDTAIVYSDIREIRPNGTTSLRRYPQFDTAEQMLWATLLRPRVPFKHSGTTFRRSVALELGSYDPALPRKVDIDLYLKFLSAGHRPRLIPEPLVNFRMHKDSISLDRMLGLRVWFQLIDRYGPRNPVTRFGVKVIRAVSETLKRLYLEAIG